MKWSIAEQRIRFAYDAVVDELWNWPGQPLSGYAKAVQHRSKFMSCGKTLPSPYGYEVYHWCRRPVCPGCSTYWGRKLARGLITAYPSASQNQFRMATLVWGITSHPDDAFDLFKERRRALANAVDYRRRRANSLDRPGWLAFGIAGALEIDYFPGEEFDALGTKKREQYRALGFVPGTCGPQWVATTHALVHRGALGEGAFRALFQGVAPVVHLQGLHEDQSLRKAAENVVGYAAKVNIETKFGMGHVEPWPLDVLKTYLVSSMRCSHGRQGYRLVINPKGNKNSSSIPEADSAIRLESSRIYAMPVVLS